MHPHLKLDALPSVVLFPGDPKRAEQIASHLEDSTRLAANREYHSYCGIAHRIPIGVVSAGVGGAGAAIAYHEAIAAGARVLIRIGTAGKLRPDVLSGDVVIATAAVREDGVSRQLLPLEFPAVADPDVVAALRQAAEDAGQRHHVGVVHTTGMFYSASLALDRELTGAAGALCVEMECSTLFIVAAKQGVAAGAILAINGDASPDKSLIPSAIDAAIVISIAAAVQLVSASSNE
ncbi:purine-nucleoside phosphorylase [Candidatus Bipolaricaulota bacterium]